MELHAGLVSGPQRSTAPASIKGGSSFSNSMKIASLFTNGMVLQQEVSVPVWGTATPGDLVTVHFAGQQVSEAADPDGRWMVRLAALEANATASQLEVSSSAGASLVKTAQQQFSAAQQ